MFFQKNKFPHTVGVLYHETISHFYCWCTEGTVTLDTISTQMKKYNIWLIEIEKLHEHVYIYKVILFYKLLVISRDSRF